MKFDKIIMNPPYNRTLHLKIAMESYMHLEESGKMVVLAPCPLLSSIRNNWSKLAIEKFASVKLYQHIVDFQKLEAGKGIKLFEAGIQQHLGIATYSTAIVKRSADCFADKPVPASLMKKIMSKCEQLSIKENPGEGEFELKISGIHGHIGEADFFDIMNKTYEAQLETKGNVGTAYFKSDVDRRAFYDFWLSPIGKFIISLWKVDTHVEPKWIPYYWATSPEKFYEDFEITEDEQKLIEETMEKCK